MYFNNLIECHLKQLNGWLSSFCASSIMWNTTKPSASSWSMAVSIGPKLMWTGRGSGPVTIIRLSSDGCKTITQSTIWMHHSLFAVSLNTLACSGSNVSSVRMISRLLPLCRACRQHDLLLRLWQRSKTTCSVIVIPACRIMTATAAVMKSETLAGGALNVQSNAQVCRMTTAAGCWLRVPNSICSFFFFFFFSLFLFRTD